MDYILGLSVVAAAASGYLVGCLGSSEELHFVRATLEYKKKQAADLASRVYSLEARLRDAGKNDNRDAKGRFARKVS